MQLAVKETTQILQNLKDFNIRPEGGPRLISDSQTCLSLCPKPSVLLDLSTALVVSRVQELFTYPNLYFVPGNLFSDNVDLLTRYRPKLMSHITPQFYSPSFLQPKVQDRVTVKVENMKKMEEEQLPHLCKRQMVFAQMKGLLWVEIS